MKRNITILATALACGVVLAYNYGRWYCADCDIPKSGTPRGAIAVGEGTLFIRSQNAAIMASNKAQGVIPRWIAGDTITICDGASCLILVYQAGGTWVPFGGTIPDAGGDYKNKPAQTGFLPIPTPFAAVSMYGIGGIVGRGGAISRNPPIYDGLISERRGTVTVGTPTVTGGVLLEWGSFGGAFGGTISTGGANGGSRGCC